MRSQTDAGRGRLATVNASEDARMRGYEDALKAETRPLDCLATLDGQVSCGKILCLAVHFEICIFVFALVPRSFDNMRIATRSSAKGLALLTRVGKRG